MGKALKLKNARGRYLISRSRASATQVDYTVTCLVMNEYNELIE